MNQFESMLRVGLDLRSTPTAESYNAAIQNYVWREYFR